MKKGYQRTADGLVYVRNMDVTASVYIDTLVNFSKDYGVPAPDLIEGAAEELYEPGVRHFYAASDGVMGGGDDPWDWGDAVVDGISNLLVAQQVRILASLPPPPPAPPAKAPVKGNEGGQLA